MFSLVELVEQVERVEIILSASTAKFGLNVLERILKRVLKGPFCLIAAGYTAAPVAVRLAALLPG